MKPWAEQFYKSAAWLACRDSYLTSVQGLCERCATKGDLVPAEIVHHKVYLTPANISDPAVSMNFENLEALCFKCHNREHFSEKKEKRFEFSADGKIFPLPPSPDEP